MNRQFNRWALALAVAAALAGPAQAQTGDQAQASPAVSGNTTVHLIRLLVEQGVITEEQAGVLMEKARREARAAQARPAAGRALPARVLAWSGS